MFINTLLQVACGILWKWFLKKLMMYLEKKGIFHSTYVSIFLVSPCSYKHFFRFSRLPETDLIRVMDEKETADECDATAESEEGVSVLYFSEIWCFPVILSICVLNSAGSAVAVFYLDCVQPNFFLCCLMLINVNTACNLIPELLLTVASAEFPAGSALVWTFFF